MSPDRGGAGSARADAVTPWHNAPVGLAHVSSGGKVLSLNEIGSRILGADEVWRLPRLETNDGTEQRVEVELPGRGQVTLACTLHTLGDGSGIVAFHDVTATARAERRVAAVAATAARLAAQSSLPIVLGAMAAEIVEADGLAGVQILVTARHAPDEMQVGGSAGFAHGARFFELVQECQALGADLAMLEVVRAGSPIVIDGRRDRVMADPKWEPLHDYLGSVDWDTFVSLPLPGAAYAVGVLNCFLPPGQRATDDLLEFLGTMAEQAATAVHHARLLQTQREDAGREERQRLGRELHDSVGQHVFSLGMQASALRLLCERGAAAGAVDREGTADWQRAAELTGRIEELGAAIRRDLRSLVSHYAPLEPRRLGESLETLTSTVARDHGIGVTLSTADVDDVRGDLADDVFFIASEAVHNALKHAKAAHIAVLVDRVDSGGRLESLLVRVSDDGRGFDPAAHPGGYGLSIMRDRAQGWGGRLEVTSEPGAGTMVAAVVPVPAPDAPGGR